METFNLEAGMPTGAQAQTMLRNELSRAKKRGVHVLKIIHGYGSTGKGGTLRQVTLDLLAKKKASGEIRDFLPGDRFEIFEPAYQKMYAADREVSRDRDVGRYNSGISVVLL